MLYGVAHRVAQIMLMQRGPQDLPAGRGLTQIAGLLFLVMSVARVQLAASLVSSIGQSLLSVIVLVGFVQMLLKWRNKPERFHQTLSALFLAGTVLGLLMLLPLAALAPILTQAAESGAMPADMSVPALPVYAWLALSLWGLMISAHIYRHALDTTLWGGLGVSLMYEFILLMVAGIGGQLAG